MKLFMTERRYRENIEMAIQNREHDLEQINWGKITIPQTWSDKAVEVQKTDITC